MNQANVIKQKDFEIKELKQKNTQLEAKIKTKPSDEDEKTCQVCAKKYKSRSDLDSHIHNDHKLQLIRSKEFLARLQGPCRGKYFANNLPFRDGRVSINVLIPVEFVCKRICAYLLMHKLYRKHAFVCLLGGYYNPSVPKWTKCGN